MARRRPATPALIAVLVAVLGGGLLVGCGGDDRDDYCAAVEASQERLGEIVAQGRPDALIQALPVFDDLADEAPRDLRDEWDTVIRAVSAFRDALEDAGVDPTTYDATSPPELDQAQRDRIASAAAGLAAEPAVRALSGIEQHALDVCKTPLGL